MEEGGEGVQEAGEEERGEAGHTEEQVAGGTNILKYSQYEDQPGLLSVSLTFSLSLQSMVMPCSVQSSTSRFCTPVSSSSESILIIQMRTNCELWKLEPTVICENLPDGPLALLMCGHESSNTEL